MDSAEERNDTLEEMKGKYFHTMKRDKNGHNLLRKYSIGSNGKLKLEQELKGVYLMGKEVRKNLSEAGQEVREHWRKIVTGDPKKRVSEYMTETPQVKLKDKFSFTLGVMTISLSQWLILRYPDYFPWFWMAFTSLLWIHRFIDYSSQKFELFMLDYCYFVNMSVAIQITFYPNHLGWFQANYALTLGPIFLAIIIWKNSLVFHSLDKLTSFFLHAFPPVMMHLYRWKFISNDLPLSDDDSLPFYSNFALAMLIYGTWQISYLIATNVLLKSYLEDKAVTTSYRYLMKGKKKQDIYKWAEKQLQMKGLLKNGEELDPDNYLGKLVFISVQLIYTLVMISHIRFLYSSYTLSVIYIVSVFGVACWNGASYYIEIFSTRYNLQFEPKQESHENKENKENDDLLENDDVFIDALQNLDLTNPDDLKIYTNVFESALK